MSSQVETSLNLSVSFAVLVERIALDAYNLEPVPTESPRIQNFIDGQFIEPLSGRYFGQHRAGDWKPYSQVAIRATAAIIAAKKLNASRALSACQRDLGRAIAHGNDRAVAIGRRSGRDALPDRLVSWRTVHYHGRRESRSLPHRLNVT